MKLADLLDEFNVVIDTAEGLNELRSLILGLAVRGKLVPQDPKDEPASELLKKIEAEKKRLYEECFIGKPKRLKPISEKEIYFLIPDKWKWVRLNRLTSYIQRGKSPKYQDGSGVVVINQKCVRWHSIELEHAKEIDPESLEKHEEKRFIQQGDILWNSTGTGTIGRLAIASDDEIGLTVDSHVTLVRPSQALSKYIWCWLAGKEVYGEIENDASGSTNQIELTKAYALNLPTPLPPLEEQQRIVQRIESLFAEVDELEEKLKQQTKLDEKLQLAVNAEVQKAPDGEASKSAWSFITSNFDSLYHTPEAIDNLKKNILNEAVRGRLVPQDPNEEPASELLKKIDAEKHRLYEEGEIRKPKKLPPVNDDEIAFDIPENWEWCRLGEIGYFTGGGTPSKNKPEYWNGDIPWVSPKDMKEDFISGAEMSITEIGVENSSANLIPEKSILIVARSGILKRVLPVGINTVTCSVNQDIKVIVPYQKSLSKYISVMLKGFESHILTNLVKQGMTVQSLKYSEFENEPFPIPPLEEQLRIVRRIEELFAICDRFKAQLEQRQAVNERLVKGLVGEVLADRVH